MCRASRRARRRRSSLPTRRSCWLRACSRTPSAVLRSRLNVSMALIEPLHMQLRPRPLYPSASFRRCSHPVPHNKSRKTAAPQGKAGLFCSKAVPFPRAQGCRGQGGGDTAGGGRGGQAGCRRRRGGHRIAGRRSARLPEHELRSPLYDWPAKIEHSPANGRLFYSV